MNFMQIEKEKDDLVCSKLSNIMKVMSAKLRRSHTQKTCFGYITGIMLNSSIARKTFPLCTLPTPTKPGLCPHPDAKMPAQCSTRLNQKTKRLQQFVS